MLLTWLCQIGSSIPFWEFCKKKSPWNGVQNSQAATVFHKEKQKHSCTILRVERRESFLQPIQTVCKKNMMKRASASSFEGRKMKKSSVHHSKTPTSDLWIHAVGSGTAPSAMKARYLFAVFGSAGMAIIYGLKVNLSVAIVAMVNQTAALDTTSHQDISRHDWENSAQDMVCRRPDSHNNVLSHEDSY